MEKYAIIISRTGEGPPFLLFYKQKCIILSAMAGSNKKNKSILDIEINSEYFLKYLEKFLFLKVKIFFFRVRKIIKKELKFFSFEEMKIFTAGMLTAGTIMWIGNYGFLNIAHSEEISNAEAKPEMNLIVPEEKKINDEALNEYKFKLSDEQCEEDKEQKKSSNLCGKDDEKELRRLEMEMQNNISSKKYKPKVAGPVPYVSARDSAGRMVCNKKNDHPQKSDKKSHKPGHMDMECCLDPDETPNPNCYYSPEKYGKYLSKK